MGTGSGRVSGRIWAAALLALATASADMPRAAPVAPSGVTDFRRGVNILGYDPYWQDPRRRLFEPRQFTDIRRAGFDFVRVNLFVFRHMDDRGAIDRAWLRRLDRVIRTATGAGLGVILDEHDSGDCAKSAPICLDKLTAVWMQLGTRYAREPRSVAFELLNEPKGDIDAAAWHNMVPRLLATIRTTNPTRPVIVDAMGMLKPMSGELPPLPPGDRNILLTFHYYDPYRFTHQGAKFSKIKELRGVTWGNSADRRALRERFDSIAQAAATLHRPMLLGEFGVYDKSGTPMPLRAAWTAAVACEAERHNFAWSYWQFSGDFALWNEAEGTWVEPIKLALLPGWKGAATGGRC